MNVLQGNSSCSLPEDVLLIIFGYLTGEDLCICEAVCKQWRTILKFGTPWRRLLQRQIARSDMWRQAWLSMGLDGKQMKREHHRSVCRALVQYSREMDNTLRAGNIETTEHILFPDFSFVYDYRIGNDYISCQTWKNPEMENSIIISIRRT
jgi:F-box-like